ncbi:sce7725 family protein [Rhodoplanes sp. TEM]|uniref:Sce7725 family protein n=1 Tax=Rhodoplanes tepidamans TaxID=200616 RepID=A0ABT5J767_RHOTP|nr:MULTISPECIES: sce7725 family protein [Rhodoplanes]MDC7785302.1 sce7725 family protein [Rhodoplanes tepidamans]MDC7987267.1 sce7725 family protein [Rhodoplanes sp. TEM]MDQ0353560.1 hypothetical protein [Rhodoplanes tepidamans]
MYFPYFRGKQFELITIRETAKLLARSRFIPIIEPVRESLSSLERTLDAICDAGGKAVVIVNPYHGDLRESRAEISKLLKHGYLDSKAISAGILLRSDTKVKEAADCYTAHVEHDPTIVHAGFAAPKAFSELISDNLGVARNVFVEPYATSLYQRHFEGTAAADVLVRDGFNRQRNADYPDMERFSELHLTYKDLGMQGFGDFLIVGDSYSEGGGPAYAVAIHLTFINPDEENVMYIYHFVSNTKDTPTDPAGKFAQALKKLVKRLDSGDSNILETEAVKEFRTLHEKRHFPGLGYVKKLSMKHHIETLSAYLG